MGIFDFFKSDFSYLPLGKLEKLDVKKSEKKSAISEVSEEPEFSTWPSRSAELYARVCRGKMGTPEVKWVQRFLMYLHPWSLFLCGIHCQDGSKKIDWKNIPLVMILTEK